MDFRRIDHGLKKAQNLLSPLPESQRSAKALKKDMTALTALYEALCCAPYHTSNESLSSHFDKPFELVQSRKVLKLGDILPAMTRFLFVHDRHRLIFAKTAWQDLDRKLTQETFDWAVHDALTDAITFMSQGPLISDVHRFWEGMLLILDKLDVNLITHALRAMEVQPDIYHLALQHLAQCDSEAILDVVIQVLRVLLAKSSKDFYAAYGPISSTTIAEQIFTNKSFNGFLAHSQRFEVVEDIRVPYALAWISPFVQSLAAVHQYEFCRSLLHHLFERFQGTDFPKPSKLACFRAGINALLTTLKTFVNKEYKINDSTSFIVVNNILGLVNQYRVTIVDCANLGSNTDEDKGLSRLSMQVIRNALALCCKSTLAEFEALKSKKDIRHGLDSYSRSIWHAVLDGFRRDNIEMAQDVLIGLKPLVGLDKLKERSRDEKEKSSQDPLVKGRVRFNSDFDQVIEMICRIFERLSDFSPSKLQQLSRNLATAYPLFAGLTPPDQGTYEATVEVIKAMTGANERRNAIARLLVDSFEITLTSLTWATRRISKYETFGGIPYLLKTSRDVLDSLCNPQDGLLRTKSSAETQDRQAIRTWWTEQWVAMATTFKNYEYWAYGSDITYMTEVCRDIMEYAETLFDQYVVLASILDEPTIIEEPKAARSERKSISRRNLLENPCKAMEHMVKWLRLRDPYLLSTLVSLLCKMLRRLAQFDMEIEKYALQEVESLGRGRYEHYKVTPQQRAELLSAWEEHVGFKISEKPTSLSRSKEGIVDFWSQSTQAAKHGAFTSSGRAIPSSSRISDDIRSLSGSLEQGRPILDLMRSRQDTKISGNLGSNSALSMAQNIKESREKAKEEKRLRDAVYIAKARALRAPPALVPGEGSGIKGIGVQGKDHGLPSKEQGVMVSSDEESEDDGTEVKAFLSTNTQRSKKVSEKERNLQRVLNQQPQGPVRKKKIVRSVNDMRARLVPNMDMLHLTILRWDIFHNGDETPFDVTFQEVSNTFQTPSEYYNTFYPLLIAEAWRSLSTAKDENNFKPFEIKVVNRLSVDSFFEVGTTMPIAENRDNNLAEGDIVLLSKGQDPMQDRTDAHCLSRVYRVTRKSDKMEISYRISGQAAGNTPLLSALSPNITIRGVKLTSMTTIEREYAALKSLEFYDLCDEILSAKPSPLLSYPSQTIADISTIYGVNAGQAKAIWSATDNDAFTLVQG